MSRDSGSDPPPVFGSKTFLGMRPMMDNHATRKAPPIREWPFRRMHRHVHLGPTSASRLDQVERFLDLSTERRIRNGARPGASILKDTVTRLADQHAVIPKTTR